MKPMDSGAIGGLMKTNEKRDLQHDHMEFHMEEPLIEEPKSTRNSSTNIMDSMWGPR